MPTGDLIELATHLDSQMHPIIWHKIPRFLPLSFLNTFFFANRAKNIKNKPKINEDPKDAMLREYQEEIQKLKSMLEGKDGDITGRIK